MERWRKERLLSIRGTPSCGKTTLARLLEAYIRSNYPTSPVIYTNDFDGSSRKGGYDRIVEIFKDAGYTNVIHPWEAENCWLIIDDAEATYMDVELWEILNRVWSGCRFVHMRIIFLASYGDPSGWIPVKGYSQGSFTREARISMRPVDEKVQFGLCLTKDELRDVVCRYFAVQKKASVKFLVQEDLIGFLDDESHGHCGVVRGLLDVAFGSWIDETWSGGTSKDVVVSLTLFQDRVQSLQILMDSILPESNLHLRGLIPLDAFQDHKLVKLVQEVIEQTDYYPPDMYDLIDLEAENAALYKCWTLGYLQCDMKTIPGTSGQKGMSFHFPSPFHQK